MRLISLGYRAKNGQIIEAKTQEEKDNLNYMNLALEELSLNLSKNIAQVLENISQQEINETSIHRGYKAILAFLYYFLKLFNTRKLFQI